MSPFADVFKRYRIGLELPGVLRIQCRNPEGTEKMVYGRPFGKVVQPEFPMISRFESLKMMCNLCETNRAKNVRSTAATSCEMQVSNFS